jgi:putative protease
MPVEEDEHGTYIMNSRDLRAIEHVERLVKIGVDSLKIEGRTKSHYYTARTVQAYRRAIDDAVAGRPFDAALPASLDNLANRGYTDGFFQRHRHQHYQNYLDGKSISRQQRFVGEITAFDKDSGLAQVEVKNRFEVGDELELITPQRSRVFRLDAMLDSSGRPVTLAPGSGHRVQIPLAPGDYRNALLARNQGEAPGQVAAVSVLQNQQS